MPLEKVTESVRAYDLIHNLRSLELSFTITEPKDKQQHYKEITAWPNIKEDTKIPEYLIPAYITCKGVFIDQITDREYPFNWIIPVYIYDDVMLRVEKIAQQQSEQKKPDEKNKVPQDKQQQEHHNNIIKPSHLTLGQK